MGHNLPQEAPQAFAQAVVDVDGFTFGWGIGMLSDTEDIVEAVVYLAEARHVTGEVLHICEKSQFAAAQNCRALRHMHRLAAEMHQIKRL